MKVKKISLSTQIKKEIGHRILFFSTAFMAIIACLTIYDVSISINQLRSRIHEQIKPIEAFAINQAMINNIDTVTLKIESFNETNPTFKIEWNPKGTPDHKSITWNFPFSWIYDYPIGNIAGIQFGFFRLKGGFLSDKTLIYDLLVRVSLLIIIAFSFYLILYPLAKKIPEKLFIAPINRFMDLISNNSYKENITKSLPVELEVLESKILALLNTATEHARNKAAIELGYLSARLAHDIRSPLAAMELSIDSLTKLHSQHNFNILINGIQSVRDIANNVLERYQNTQTNTMLKSQMCRDDGNVDRPILLFTIIEMTFSQKRYEWGNQPCTLNFKTSSEAKLAWIKASPNEIRRLLSNLLNNSYDAIYDKKIGAINLSLHLTDHNVEIDIDDNGYGIPTEKINDILNGLSLKHGGNGLGLSGAKTYIENLGGKLHLASTLEKGTSVKLIFPKTKDVTWFKNEIILNHINTAIVLDDDFSILMYWEQRLSEFNLKPKLFSDYHSALNWVMVNKQLIPTTIFIVDYYLTEAENGLMFLEKIDDNNHRYLITDSAETLHCQQAAEKAGVWLIPKSLAKDINLTLLH